MPEAVIAGETDTPYTQRLRMNTDFAMAETSLFFEEKGKVYETLRRITGKLDSFGIAYAVSGGLALGRYGFVRATDDVDILTTREGLATIHERLNGLGYVHVFRGSKAMRDVTSGVKIDFLITGQYPGDGKLKPVAFPDPEEAGATIDGVRFLKLERLIELKLASGMTAEHRGKDLIDVQELITAIGLQESFAKELNEYVRPAYRECWRKTRRRYVRLWRNKFLTLHAGSIEEMAETLRGAANELDAMLRDGVILDPEGGAGDDYAMLVTDDPGIARKYDMHDEQEYFGDLDPD